MTSVTHGGIRGRGEQERKERQTWRGKQGWRGRQWRSKRRWVREVNPNKSTH